MPKPDSVHPRLEQVALGTVEETEDGDWFLSMPECTKTASDVSVNLSDGTVE